MEYLGAWLDPVYQKASLGIAGYMILLGSFLFPIRKKNINFKTAWFIFLSWLFALPIVLLILGLSQPLPLIGICIVAIIAMKEFFQMTGVYQEYLFVWLSYIVITTATFCIYNQWNYLFNLLPMILFGLLFQIPLLKNQFKGMLQKTSIVLTAYIFLGWSFLHLGFITQWEYGIRYIIYIFILTEFYDTIILSWSKLFGKINYIDKIAPKRSMEGLIIALLSTLLLARGIRNILPLDHDVYWIASGFIASLIGGLGDISMGVIRRDLGVKDVGAYIFGRAGVIDRIDRLIFVAPIFYYTIILLRDYYQYL